MPLTIGRAGIGTRLSRFFDIRGGRVASELEPTIQPVAIVADLREDPEMDTGAEVVFFQGFADLDPIAGQFAELIVNVTGPTDPSRENVIRRIHDVWVSGTGGPNLCRLGVGDVNFQTQVPFVRLSRPTVFDAPTNTITNNVLTSQLTATPGGSKAAFLRVAVESNATVHVPCRGLQLAPGTGFSVWTMVADIAVSFSIRWSDEPIGGVRLR